MTVVDLDTHRREKVGGSEAADACNLGYRGRLMLWYEKVNGIATVDNEAMWLGRALQERVAELVTERDGYEILPAPADGFVHPELPWMIVHPDGITGVDGRAAVAEIKTRGLGWSQDDDRALWGYELQVQHGMAVMGYDAGLLAILHGGHGGLRLETREIERDDKLIARMIELEQEIVDAVRTQQPPERRGHPRDEEAVRLMHPTANGKTVRLSKAGWQARNDFAALDEQEKVVKRQKAEKRQIVELEMGDATHAISPFDTPAARWPQVESTRLDTKALKAARPDVYSEFAVATSTRRFTLE